MKYFEVKIKLFIVDEKGKRLSIGDANGEKVPNGESYFAEMRQTATTGPRRILDDTPVFDYFFLENFDKPSTWERYLQDAHHFIGESPDGWFISNRFKCIFEKLNIMPQYHFYPSKLLYNGEKLDYWVFQFGVNHLDYVNFSKSIFTSEDSKIIGTNIDSSSALKVFEEDIEEYTICTKLVLKEPYDFVVAYGLGRSYFVSEHFKNTIEAYGIEGLEFKEIDFEIVCE